MEPALEGHKLAGRLKEDDKKIVRDLTTSNVHPRNILINLKSKRQHCITNIKQVFNERQQIWKSNRGDKTALQYLISKLEAHNYVYFSRTQSESTTIEDIFWAHPTSVKLFNNFPTVLVMDSTYKTNMHKMPMFEIVGVTSTDLTYSVGFGFLTHEKEENFVWVLKMTCKLLTLKMNMPCACFIATKIREDKPIFLDEIHHHWQKLCMGQESNEDSFSVEDAWNGIQERLKKVPYQMKLEMKEVLWQLAFPDTTMLSPPPRKVPTKGAKEKVDIARYRAKVTSTSRIPSSWEVDDS